MLLEYFYGDKRMIKYYCDKCKKEIDASSYSLRLDVRFGNTRLDPLDKVGEICKECSFKLGTFIVDFFNCKE